jgi:hypothetical protein
MKVCICEICYREKNKASFGRYTISFKNGQGLKISLDACEEHKGYFKNFVSFKDAEEAVNALYSRPVKSIDKIF